MLDIKTQVGVELTEILSSMDGVDTMSYDNSDRFLENMEQMVCISGGICLGDLDVTQEQYSYGKDLNTYELEMFIVMKNNEARALCDENITLMSNKLRQNDLNLTQTTITEIKGIGKQQFVTNIISYKPILLEVHTIEET